MHDAVVLVFSNTLTPSTTTRLRGRKTGDLWWWNAGGTGGDSAVASGKVHTPGVDSAGSVKVDKSRGRGRGKGKRAGDGSVVLPPAK